MAHATLTAPDISCQHCKSTIESGLRDKPGVQRVEVDIEARRVALDWDESQTDETALRDELAELGYPAD
jgi:copper chaperone CopZ